jgi:hypothetical protein
VTASPFDRCAVEFRHGLLTHPSCSNRASIRSRDPHVRDSHVVTRQSRERNRDESKPLLRGRGRRAIFESSRLSEISADSALRLHEHDYRGTAPGHVASDRGYPCSKAVRRSDLEVRSVRAAIRSVRQASSGLPAGRLAASLVCHETLDFL